MSARLAAAGVVLAVSAMPAQATEWLICSDGDKASFNVLLGQMQVIALNDIDITVGDKKWSNRNAAGATKISNGQAFESTDQVLIDVADEAGDAIVAQLRLFKTEEDGEYVSGGTLRVVGEGAWAVTCSGP